MPQEYFVKLNIRKQYHFKTLYPVSLQVPSGENIHLFTKCHIEQIVVSVEMLSELQARNISGGIFSLNCSYRGCENIQIIHM